MESRFTPGVGRVQSADIAVKEHERELGFYSQVLTTGAGPLWGEDLLNNLGIPIIGLGQWTPEYDHLPLQWMPHIQVEDVARSAARAVELGGQELLHGKDDAGNSLWAGLLDPNGAGFGIIPVPPVDAVPKVDEGTNTGSIAWLDITVPDAAGAKDFYQAVAGWSVEEFAMKDDAGTYHDFSMLDASGQAVAGICHARGPNTGLPPVWLLYLPVGDLNESLRRVESGGGKILQVGPESADHPQTVAVQDPLGVSFALIEG